MANKIIRGPDRTPGLRDSAGKYTAFTFPTRKGQVWVSNKALGLVLGSILSLLVALEPGVGAAKDMLFDWALRLTTLR